MLAEMINNVADDADERKKRWQSKSLYQMAAEMKNETMAPSVDSYGGSNVFMRYKKNKWFENFNIIALKRIRDEEDGQMLTELLDIAKKNERDKLRKKQQQQEEQPRRKSLE